jgi:hypothetical protein
MNKSTALLLGSAAIAAMAILSCLLTPGDARFAATGPAPGEPAAPHLEASSPGRGLAASRVPAGPNGVGDTSAAGSRGSGNPVHRDHLRANAPLSAISAAQGISATTPDMARVSVADHLPMEFLGQPPLVGQGGGMQEFDLPPGLRVPAALVAPDPVHPLAAGQEQISNQIKARFLGAVNGSATDTPDGPVVGAGTWTAAQKWADNRYRTLFGDAAYQRQSLEAARTQAGSRK